MAALKGTYVQKYLRYGERTAFASKKSRAVPVPERSTCQARHPWYDLTRTQRGTLVWSKSQQYRHVVVHNKNRLIVNCNLYDMSVVDKRPVRLKSVQQFSIRPWLDSLSFTLAASPGRRGISKPRSWT